MTFSAAIRELKTSAPVPTRIIALAILDAYREANVPLPYQAASDWYSTGGRYWRQVWTVCGYRKRGDKFIGPQSIRWAEPLPPAEASALWADLEALADASDAWQLSQGQEVEPPRVDVGGLVARSVTWWDRVTTINPIWEWGDEHRAATSKRLIAVLKQAAKQLDEWYRRRFPGRPPLPPPMPSVGAGPVIALVALVAIASSSRRRGRRR